MISFSIEAVKMCKEKKIYILDAEDCDRWDSAESVVKNEEIKDAEGFQFLLSCLD